MDLLPLVLEGGINPPRMDVLFGCGLPFPIARCESDDHQECSESKAVVLILSVISKKDPAAAPDLNF